MLRFTGERIVPEADNCEPQFARKMYQEHIARYLFASQLVQGRQVLDVGCGVGYGSRILAQQGATHVTALDISAEAISHARAHYKHPAVDFRVESASEFHLARTFDVVICFELIEHVPAEAQEQVLGRIAEHLSEDGVLLISTPRALAEKRSPFHTREYTQEEFQKALQRHFGHTAFFFENNHFASLVTSGLPRELRRIEVIGSAPFELADADYFICVASRKPLDLSRLESQLVLNDENYVKLLERDVEILHRAENTLREERSSLEKRLTDAEKDLAGTRSRLAEREATAAQLETRAARLEARLDDAMQQRGTLTKRVEGLSQQLVDALRELELWKQRAEGALAQVDQVLNSRSWRYAEPLRASKRQLKRIARKGKQQVNRVSEFFSRPQDAGQHSASPDAAQPVHPAAVQHVGPAFESEVLFVVGCHEGESKRYRVVNVSEALGATGVSTLVMSDAQLPEMIARGVKAKALVIFRAAWTEELGKLIALARKAGARVFFDVDDLIFEPENIDNVRVVRDAFGPEERAQYLEGVKRYRRTLLECDAVTCPTDFLRQRAEALGRQSYVLPNTLNHRQIEIARGLPPKTTTPGAVRIGYFSGSNTHQVDFSACEPALLRLMEAYPQVRFVLVGILDLGPAWNRFASRVERVSFQPYEQMLKTLSNMDINLAPLEVGNPYCEGKSQLKIFEAGLVHVPTVASATSSYAASIDHGVDGFLARTEAEWFTALEALVKDPELRGTVGEKAHARALAQFSLEALGPVARDAFLVRREEAAPPPEKAEARPARKGRKILKVSWVVPGLPLGSGGHRNIIRVAYHLQRFGHDLELYFTGTDETGPELTKKVQKHFYPLDCPMFRYQGDFNATDVIFATHWSTVEVALRHRSQAEHLAYFVQDFEPLFYPMGSEYILAENTYRQGLYHITSGPWCAHLLREQYHVPAEHFIFPIDRDIYYPRPRAEGGPLRVLFFGRPEMPRRCYDIGLSMLKHLHQLVPDVELNLYGSRELASHSFPFPAKVHALLPGIQDLANLYASSDVGVAFSTTNPSLVPYEMMACGLPVVDLHRPGNEINYGGRQDIALLADPIPERMAIQVAELLKDPAERARRSKAGIELVSTFPNEEQMARRVEELLLKLYA
ncbi:rhamnosyltransferase WsaF family glycosyltransferase [Hyalangium versicolor]|uniref:rhamnosyltransferase WsaF family glycosyltransferase n=1 Tax=Hyalangium versicolor TaxID=2861190 RepID=UPI001CCBEB40|nr:methyltransferase domain-containing protein [Hyalangium versicolor]